VDWGCFGDAVERERDIKVLECSWACFLKEASEALREWQLAIVTRDTTAREELIGEPLEEIGVFGDDRVKVFRRVKDAFDDQVAVAVELLKVDLRSGHGRHQWGCLSFAGRNLVCVDGTLGHCRKASG
jgi:hypothetical protein